MIEVYDYDDPYEGPYGEIAIIITMMNHEELSELFGEQFPNEICELDVNDSRYIYIPEIQEQMKVLALWWD